MSMGYTSRRSAYTLLEILVVILILGLLLAIAVPMIQGSRETARLAICMSNEKEIARMTDKFMLRSSRMFPTPWQLASVYDPKVMKCASDEDPYVLPADFIENCDHDWNLSYAFNVEYDLFKMRKLQITRPAERAVSYDGLGAQDTSGNGGQGQGQGQGGGGQGQGQHIMVCHHPPGNPNNVIVQNVGAPAFAAHAPHGDWIMTRPDGYCAGMSNFDGLAYGQSNFLPRHPIGEGVGTVLFADWHVEYVPKLEARMFMHSATGGGNGKGNGGGN
ncbi:MAG: prepilin-type N-terminal cleavage/methylation domain-containing protein [Phycisphaerae bacterium]|nr:prepilin-type N-terminal cleavage/methylation domain-containing protein [Phycisphaerae bacterium]